MPFTAMAIAKCAAGLDRGVLGCAIVLNAVGTFSLLIVQCNVREIDVTSNDDLTVLVGECGVGGVVVAGVIACATTCNS